MALTAGALRELLEGVEDDTPIRLATQPGYPLEFNVAGLAFSDDVEGHDGPAAIWILEGNSRGYASSDLWDACTLG